MHQAVERLADLAASYMVAGFVHGVLNSDNMNVTGESFDYGPWRWLPQWDPGFTAAYFDHAGLYAFGRQPEAIRWNLGAAGDRAAAAGRGAAAGRRDRALSRALPRGDGAPVLLAARASRAAALERDMRADRARPSGRCARAAIGPDAFFFAPSRRPRRRRARWPRRSPATRRWQTIIPTGPATRPQAMLIDEVEAIWAAIAERDDWQPLAAKIAAVRAMGEALGRAAARRRVTAA